MIKTQDLSGFQEEPFVSQLIEHGFVVWIGSKGELLIAWPSEMIPDDDNALHPRDLLLQLRRQHGQLETLYLVEAVQ